MVSFAEVADEAFIAVGFSRSADVSAVKNKPVVRIRKQLRWNVLHQLLLCGKWCRRVVGEPDSVAHSVYVGIHRHCRFSPHYSKHYVCCLSSNPGQSHQVVDIRWHLGVEFLYKHTRRLYQVARLVVGICHTFYISIHLFLRGQCQ